MKEIIIFKKIKKLILYMIEQDLKQEQKNHNIKNIHINKNTHMKLKDRLKRVECFLLRK